MSPVLGLLALFMLAKPSASSSSTAPASPTSTPSKPGARVVGQVLQIPLSDGTGAIVAKLQLDKLNDNTLDAIVIARGTVYGSRNGVAAVLRCGSEADAKAIADEIRGKF
jgi:hypothetical protein